MIVTDIVKMDIWMLHGPRGFLKNLLKNFQKEGILIKIDNKMLSIKGSLLLLMLGTNTSNKICNGSNPIRNNIKISGVKGKKKKRL